MRLFFDTETTGLWEKSLPCGDPRQPRIMQIGAILADPDRRELMRLDVVLYQEQPCPTAASNIHKTTTEVSHAIGVNENAALDIFCDMLQAAETVVAHNIEFDVNIINNACRLLSGNPKLDVFAGKQKICTMKATIPICRFPSKFHKGEYAWPKLVDAVPKLLHREPTAAHQAIGDVIDCRDLFYYLEDLIAAKGAPA